MADPPIVAWTIRDWAKQTSLSKSYIYVLIAKNKIESVKAGKRRLIRTPPEVYLRSLVA